MHALTCRRTHHTPHRSPHPKHARTLLVSLALLATACSAVVPRADTSHTATAANAYANPRPTTPHTLHIPGAPPIELIHVPGHGTTNPFWLARTELTYAQFAPFVQATHYDGSDHPSSRPSEDFLQDWNGNPTPPPDRLDHPVCYLNVHHARAFCVWASRTTGCTVRLPTDAEWELAARGPEGRTFPWGDEWDLQRCNSGTPDDGFAGSAPVGSFPRGATPEGVLDLAGNIWEWTAEGHLRGGPWCMGPDTVKSAFVAREDTERADDKFGFRVVVEP
ncbi:MAG: SUMF1/EgtB/PvdO family nonheme iron enzyme [Planctomycetes bacterium]|nr:SUMF1/EgtB/PvdO family nonheme iron enzyme [Planctomycetota bacterium]